MKIEIVERAVVSRPHHKSIFSFMDIFCPAEMDKQEWTK